MALYNVPLAPGIPPIRRNPLALINTVSILATNLIRLFSTTPPWGIYRNGRKIVTADTVVGFDFKRDWSLTDAPLEGGSFESFNKVEIPYDARVRFASGQSIERRARLLDSIDAIAGDLLQYDVVTPEKTWTSMNVVHVDYRRTVDKGLGLLIVDVWLSQVRLTAVAAFTQTKSASGANPTNGGTVQTAPATTKQSALSSLVQ
jgi:hypothetical protein